MNFIVGLGNPSGEYEGTRHNVGREIVESFGRKYDFPEFGYDKKVNAYISEGKIGRDKVTLILPDTYMNKSGVSLKKFITSTKKAEKMLVIHDDLDLGLGDAKIVYNKGDGGHRGIISVIRAVRTKAFPRMKVGISPVTPSGKVKKINGEEKVVKHVLSKFSPKEEIVLKKLKKDAVEAIEIVVTEGYLSAMNWFN